MEVHQWQCSGWFIHGAPPWLVSAMSAVYITPLPFSPQPKFLCWDGTHKGDVMCLVSLLFRSQCLLLILNLLYSHSICTSLFPIHLHVSISGFINMRRIPCCAALCCCTLSKKMHVRRYCVFLFRMPSVPVLTGAGSHASYYFIASFIASYVFFP